MSIWGNVKKAHWWEWIALAFGVGLLLYAFGCLHGCHGAQTVKDTVEKRGTEVLIGTGLGAGAALLLGATGVGIIVGPLVAAGAVVFATPECGTTPSSQTPPAPSHWVETLIFWAVVVAVLYMIWTWRKPIIALVKKIRIKR